MSSFKTICDRLAAEGLMALEEGMRARGYDVRRAVDVSDAIEVRIDKRTFVIARGFVGESVQKRTRSKSPA
jgi:hypothetical protein